MMKHDARSRTGSTALRQPPLVAYPFVFAALVAVLGLVLTYLFFVKSTTGQFLDESALVEAGVARRLIGAPTSQVLDALPATSVVIALLVILFVTLARRRWKAAGLALAAMAAANLTTQVVKWALPDRPDVGVDTLALNSLPSGHSTLAASAAAAVFLVVSPRWRPAAAWVGGSYAILAGVSTLVNQWHRPSDVIAAFFVVALWTSLAGLAIVRTGTPWNVWLGGAHHWASRLWWTLASLTAAVGVGTVTILLLRELGAHSSNSTSSYFLSGVGQIVTVGYGLAFVGTVMLTYPLRRRG